MINRIKRYTLKSVCVLAACAAITVSCATVPSGSQTRAAASTRQRAEIDSRQRIYMAHLREEGYAPSIDDDGDIAFKREGYTYYVIIDETDPTLLFLLLPNIKALNTDADRARAADAISHANANTKVAKAYLARQNQRVNIAAEIYLENPDHFAVLFKRLVGSIDAAREYFESSW